MRKILRKALDALGLEVFRRAPSHVRTLTLHSVVHTGQAMRFLVNNPRDAVQSHHAHGRLYEPEECAIMDAHFPGGVFVDVGANVGNHTVYFGCKARTARVIAFEPNLLVQPLLAANVDYNRLGEKVELHRFALSDTAGEIELAIPAHNMGAASFSGTRDARKAQRTVPSSRRRGDDVASLRRIDFLKIDVEGHEAECLEGLRQTIKANLPPVFIEVAQIDRPRIEALLFSFGYALTAEHARYAGSTNLLFTHPQRGA